MLEAGPIDLLVADAESGVCGWVEKLVPPLPTLGATFVVMTGAVHFVRCLRGEEVSRLTPDQAVHVVEIIEKAHESAADGRALELETKF
jgi:predicted dehydrogenase